MNVESLYCRHWVRYVNGDRVIPQITYTHPYYNDGKHDILHIYDSLHYKALVTDNFNDYNQYITATSQQEHSVPVFKELLATFDSSKMNPIKVEYHEQIGKYVILDGVHRVCLYLFLHKQTEFPCDKINYQ